MTGVRARAVSDVAVASASVSRQTIAAPASAGAKMTQPSAAAMNSRCGMSSVSKPGTSAMATAK